MVLLDESQYKCQEDVQTNQIGIKANPESKTHPPWSHGQSQQTDKLIFNKKLSHTITAKHLQPSSLPKRSSYRYYQHGVSLRRWHKHPFHPQTIKSYSQNPGKTHPQVETRSHIPWSGRLARRHTRISCTPSTPTTMQTDFL